MLARVICTAAPYQRPTTKRIHECTLSRQVVYFQLIDKLRIPRVNLYERHIQMRFLVTHLGNFDDRVPHNLESE